MNIAPPSTNSALDIAAALVEAAHRHGADHADALHTVSRSQSISMRLGNLEDVDRSESAEAGLRVFVGQRTASVSGSDLSPAAIDELAERAVAMARIAPEDKYAGLAPADRLLKGEAADFELVDPSSISPKELREMALAAEDAARAVAGVTNSEGGGASASEAQVTLATSNGFAASYRGTSFGISASVIAGSGEAMQRDYAYRAMRHREDLLAPEEIGRLAGERAVARLDPAAIASGPMPVVFAPRVGGSLVGHLVGAMSGAAVARQHSFLIGHEKEMLFPSDIRIVEDPHKLRGQRSRPFDGEGVPTARKALVENGQVTGWLTNVASAAQLGLDLTGNATRGIGGSPGVGSSNLDLLASETDVADLISDIRDGVLIDYLIGQGVNPVTGDYSRGAAGRRIVNGEITGPIAGFTIAGNLLEMFSRMRVANDLETWRAINVPTIRIDGMTVAGG
ncbi:TldD/PmbA family protein [Tsuneonella mangrovi]|uniref:TldD/PmbA family protein n=1 Tax=Tsuneonella mangrovi TaxID=1982042 RepID=UPI000BA28659|nr:TldD/PmbA family protein [Tsuneonella mangrovi]